MNSQSPTSLPKQTSRHSQRARQAFTLVEMIGVLAIIAILAVVIVPKVFAAISSSRVNSTIVSMDAVKSATTDFVAKYGVLPTTGGNARFDDLLRTAGYMDERFSSKLGLQMDTYGVDGSAWTRNSNGTWSQSGGANQGAQTRIISLTSNTTSPSTAAGRNFQLDGASNLPAGSRVVSAMIESVPASDAYKLSEALDGTAFSSESGADSKGKVVYRAPSGGLTDVYIYILHQ